MGRGHKHSHPANDKNSKTLPQTPKKDIVQNNDEIELAKELTAHYNLKAKPGFPPTEVERNDDTR
ncbi:YfhD family protein [Pseudalkalibacillus decolorationis]|uniref:YfhD family protein n=1 Tax=Pseudalkalibacillus decolorationis TaxID=163879 RepID=UPI0021475F35|nr:YfhD family protein [Pseudalkalibacillus decolorationis]